MPNDFTPLSHEQLKTLWDLAEHLPQFMDIRRLLCRHESVTNVIVASGYGHTEYFIWFCKRCEKLLWRQTRSNQD